MELLSSSSMPWCSGLCESDTDSDVFPNSGELFRYHCSSSVVEDYSGFAAGILYEGSWISSSFPGLADALQYLTFTRLDIAYVVQQHGLLFAEDILQDSCKAIAVFAEQTTEVQALAYQYGRHLGIAYQLIDDILNFTGTSASLGKASLSDIHQGIVTAPIPFAMEEFPELREIVEQGFDDPLNVKTALKYLSKSQGIERTRSLAAEHAKLAAGAIDDLPDSEDQVVLNSRQALKDLTQKFMRRTK
nr:solanesyl-diphosphate synthase 1, mitochondrial-like [Setaria viridis]